MIVQRSAFPRPFQSISTGVQEEEDLVQTRWNLWCYSLPQKLLSSSFLVFPLLFLWFLSNISFSPIFLQYFRFSPTSQAGGEDHTGWDSCPIGNYESSLRPPFNALTCIFGFGPPRVKSPQPGIKPFSTPLTAHFRAVSFKPVAAICIKMGSFVHGDEEEYRRNMKSLFPVLTAEKRLQHFLKIWTVWTSPSHKHYDRAQWGCHKQTTILYLQI